MKNFKSQKGFVALISAIIISALLLTIALATNMTGISNRLNILDAESKNRSSNLAEACADKAILEAVSGIYSMGVLNTVGPATDDKCTIVSAQLNSPTTGQTLIKTQSVVNKAYTNLKVVLDSDYNIVSWEEVSNF